MSNSTNVIPPYTSAETVTPDDVNDLALVTRGLVVHAASGQHAEVAVIFANDAAPVTVACRIGIAMPFRVRRVLSTGTTAGADIVALY